MLLFLYLINKVMGDPSSNLLQYRVQEDFVPIIGYHQIGNRETSTIVPYERFHEQVKYLTEDFGCNWLSMQDLTDHIIREEKLPTNACIMNFDDSAASQLFSMCSLNKYRIPATFYILPGNLGDSNEYISSEDWIVRYIELNGRDKHDYYMYPQEIELIRSWGHDIQPHTLQHPDLSTLTYDEQYNEIYRSIETLEDWGYDVRTFAYPFGKYNDDTLSILQGLIDNNRLTLARATEKKNSWREPRAATFNISDVYSYNYIKPEEYTPEELADKIKYTNWWQFEENYVLTKDGVRQNTGVQELARSYYTPGTETSFAVLDIKSQDVVIETTFAIKYRTSVVIDVLSCNGQGGDSGYYITLDDSTRQYTPEKWSTTNEKYMSIRRTWPNGDEYVWNNFYIVVSNLAPGVHRLKLHKTTSNNLYLDKFRVYAEIDQTFSKRYTYGYDCSDANDKNCDCSYDEVKEGPSEFFIQLTEIQIVLIICSCIGCCSLCLCMNSGSNREFKKYGHIQRQRENFLR